MRRNRLTPLFLALFLSFAGCGGDDAGAPAPQSPPPADVPENPENPDPARPLEGNWSLQGASCDGRPVLVYSGMVTLEFTGDRMKAATHLLGSCNYLPEGDVSFPDETTLSITNSTLYCSPAACDTGCGQADPGPQSISYTRTGDTLVLESSESSFIEMCSPGEVTRLRFTKTP
ncbi:MAG TPA: hypothetical protein VM598_11060 [Bdellovibrionota bacterium]|nr:hypothetical protein [Bdellovibrionota bacterium]